MAKQWFDHRLKCVMDGNLWAALELASGLLKAEPCWRCFRSYVLYSVLKLCFRVLAPAESALKWNGRQVLQSIASDGIQQLRPPLPAAVPYRTNVVSCIAGLCYTIIRGVSAKRHTVCTNAQNKRGRRSKHVAFDQSRFWGVRASAGGILPQAYPGDCEEVGYCGLV